MITLDVRVTTAPSAGGHHLQRLPVGTHAVTIALGLGEWVTSTHVHLLTDASTHTLFEVGTAQGGIEILQVRGAARPSNSIGVTRFTNA